MADEFDFSDASFDFSAGRSPVGGARAASPLAPKPALPPRFPAAAPPEAPAAGAPLSPASVAALERRWEATLAEFRVASSAREAELQALLAAEVAGLRGALAEADDELAAARADNEARVADLLRSQATLSTGLSALAAENVALRAAAEAAGKTAVEAVAAAEARHAEELAAQGRRLSRALAQNELLRAELSGMANSVLAVLVSPRRPASPRAASEGVAAAEAEAAAAGTLGGGSRRGSPEQGALGDDAGFPPARADLAGLFESSLAPAAPLSPAMAALARMALGVQTRAY
jgi:hypothetical protein